MIESKKIGDPCPKCGKPLEKRDGLMYWRGTFYPAAYCGPCNAMWSIEGEEMPPFRPQTNPST